MDLSAVGLLELRFHLCPSVRIRRDDKIAFEPRSGCIAELNDVGFVLMRAAELGLPVDSVVGALANHYQTDVAAIAADVAEFYGQMVKRGFLTAEKVEAVND